MKLKDTGVLPEKKEVIPILGLVGEIEARLIAKAHNNLLSEIGEIDLNELIDEGKLYKVLEEMGILTITWQETPYSRIKTYKIDDLARAIKSSDIWKEQK